MDSSHHHKIKRSFDVESHADHGRHQRDWLRARSRPASRGRSSGHHRNDDRWCDEGRKRPRRRLRHPGRIAGIVCDVRDAASVELALRTTAARFGGIDVLINNAGVGVGVPISEMPHDEWHRIIGTNLTGVFNCCKAAIPLLKARGGGWIVNISSLAGSNPFVGGAAYCASKAGLNAFSEALMQELRYDNIRVTYVMPGSVATGFSGREASSGSDWRLLPEDVAQAIVDVMNHPPRSLPSRVEIRPSRPKK